MLQAMLRLSLSGLLALAASGAQAQVNTSFKDWSVTCDNTRVCAAFGFSTGPGDGYVKIERSPGPGGRLQAGLVINLDEDATAPTRWALKLDGKPLAGFGALKSQPGDWGQVIGLDDDQSRQLVEAIRDAGSLTLTASRTEPVEISLSGSSASLRFIDDQQGRVGLSDALVAKGAGSPLAAPEGPAQPIIQAPAAADQSDLPGQLPAFIRDIRKDEDCDSLGSQEDFPVIKARLAPNLMLWGALCSSGAYNFGYKLFTSDERGRGGKAVLFPYAKGSGDAETVYAVNADFDPESLVVSAFEKGRGLGDCGSLLRWVWNGSAFVLLRQDIMSDCRGVVTEHWPTLFRATVDQAMP
jgi:hypothetical protein